MNEFNLKTNSKIDSGFKTPEHYFDDFPQRISQRLSSEQPKVIPLKSRNSKWLVAIAAILVIALCIPFFNKISPASTELDAVATENYLSIQAGISDQLVDLLDEEDIQEMQNDITFEDKDVEDLLSTNPDLELYIIN